MAKSLREHIGFIENILKKESGAFDWDALSDFNRTQIGFFQHERLIHLLITLFFGLMFFASVVAELLLVNNFFLVINIILVVMLCFYVWHYFVLENGVQKLYKLDREILKRCRKNIGLE